MQKEETALDRYPISQKERMNKANLVEVLTKELGITRNKPDGIGHRKGMLRKRKEGLAWGN